MSKKEVKNKIELGIPLEGSEATSALAGAEVVDSTHVLRTLVSIGGKLVTLVFLNSSLEQHTTNTGIRIFTYRPK